MCKEGGEKFNSRGAENSVRKTIIQNLAFLCVSAPQLFKIPLQNLFSLIPEDGLEYQNEGNATDAHYQ